MKNGFLIISPPIRDSEDCGGCFTCIQIMVYPEKSSKREREREKKKSTEVLIPEELHPTNPKYLPRPPGFVLDPLDFLDLFGVPWGCGSSPWYFGESAHRDWMDVHPTKRSQNMVGL